MRPHNTENWDEGRFDVADGDLRSDRIQAAAERLRKENVDLVEISDVLRLLGVDTFTLRRDRVEVTVG